MTIPPPQPGLVISYSFLWNSEHRQGRHEGAKNRPCVIVVSSFNAADGKTMVRVAPVTHTPPADMETAVELPLAVKRHLGLDDQRSWVTLDEMNVFGRSKLHGGVHFEGGRRRADMHDHGEYRAVPDRLSAREGAGSAGRRKLPPPRPFPAGAHTLRFVGAREAVRSFAGP